MWKYVLLDVDGTLLDSNQAHSRAWEEAFAAYGYAISADVIYPLVGLGGDKLLARLTPGLSDKEGVGKEIATRRKAVFHEKYLRTVHPTPGARNLIVRIKTDGMVPVVATSADDDELASLLSAARVADLIDEQANASDAEGSKPDPDIVQAALQRAGAKPAEAIMVGDTPFDVEAAEKCGLQAIGFRSGGHDADLYGALAVYDDPADLLAHWDSSPFGAREAVAP